MGLEMVGGWEFVSQGLIIWNIRHQNTFKVGITAFQILLHELD